MEDANFHYLGVSFDFDYPKFWCFHRPSDVPLFLCSDQSSNRSKTMTGTERMEIISPDWGHQTFSSTERTHSPDPLLSQHEQSRAAVRDKNRVFPSPHPILPRGEASSETEDKNHHPRHDLSFQDFSHHQPLGRPAVLSDESEHFLT